MTELAEYNGKKIQQKIIDDMLNLNTHYKPDIEQYVLFCRERTLPVGLESLKAFKEELDRQGFKASTINKKLAGIRSSVAEVATKYLNIKEIQILKHALREVKGIKLNKNSKSISKEKILSPEEVQNLMKNTSPRLSLMIQFLYTTGVRASEMCGIKSSDLKNKDKYTEVRVIGKGSKERKLKVDKRLIGAAKDAFKGRIYLFETRGGKPFRRQYVSDEIRKAGKRILDRTISAHTLRHSFSTNMIAKTNKLKAVSEYLGHSSTAITLDMYVHEELSLEDLDLA